MKLVYLLITVLWALVALAHVQRWVRPDRKPDGTRRKRQKLSLIIAVYPLGWVFLGLHLRGWLRPPPAIWSLSVVVGALVVGIHLVGRWEQWRRRASAHSFRESDDGEGLAPGPPRSSRDDGGVR